MPQPVAKDTLCSLTRAALRNCSKIFQETKYEGMTYPAHLGGVLPSWYLTLPGCGYVSGTGCVTAEPLAASVRVGHCDLWTGRENKKLTSQGSVVIFHLRSEGAIQNSLVRAWEAIKLFNKFQSIRNS